MSFLGNLEGIHFHTSPSTVLLWVAPNQDHWPCTDSTKLTPSPFLHLLGLGRIYFQWLWFISRCLWPGTGCLQIAPQRVGKCRHLPFCEALSRNEKDSHKMLCGGEWRVGNMHHKKRNGLMLIHRLAPAQGCLLSSDINIGEAPRRQIFYFFDLMVGGSWAYFFLCFSDCGHSSGNTTSLSETEAPQCFMASRAERLLERPEGQEDLWVHGIASQGESVLGFVCIIPRSYG